MEKGKQTTKTVVVRNADERDKLIKNRGQETFDRFKKKDPERWGKLEDIPVPERYRWLWVQFLSIWQGCEYDFAGNIKFTFGVLNDYMQCFHIPFSITERRLLFKMKSWACAEINDLRDDDK